MSSALLAAAPDKTVVPIRGLHLSAPSKGELEAALKFIREDLPREGVNTLVLEFDYNFNFQSRPGFSDPSALGQAEAKELARACREHGIELIPQLNCLGHQSWSSRNGRLLQKHPEFDETSGKYPENKGIYCRSYCPLHPRVHEVLFDLIDELARACDARAFHVGMDEVFILADPDCPRCRGKDTAEIFAGEVNRLHKHLQGIGCRMWMWGDRFIDGKATGLGKWEASENNTASAIDRVPKDILICDWHYDAAPDTARFFAEKGFDVVACPWRKPQVALDQFKKIQALRQDGSAAIASHAQGMLQTTWCGFTGFRKAYEALRSGAAPEKSSASESAQTFLELCETIRESGNKPD